jgi:DNA-cytosine methyltransferase
MGIRVLSLFDGMGCGLQALKDMGEEVSEYHAFEIDPHCITVAKRNHPEIIHHGSVVNADFSQFIGFDLLIGGSPCQDFSFAGKQIAFNDPRSALFFEFVRAKQIVQPTFFLFENVKMKQESLDVISEALRVHPVVINSALVSAQNRVRYYWTNLQGFSLPFDLKQTWGDIRERGVNGESYYYTEKAMQWLGRHSRSHNKTLRVHTDHEKMQMLEASHSKKYSSQRFFGIVDMTNDEQAVAAMRGRYLVGGKRQDDKMFTKGLTTQYIEFRYDGKTNALTTVGKDNVVVPFTLPDRVPVDEFFFRYITPLECERLQTLPDGYTDGVSNTQRYRMLGNGWTVKVISHILLKGRLY